MKKFAAVLLAILMMVSVHSYDYVLLNKKQFPLPSKYRGYKSSEQGLRDLNGTSIYHYAVDYACPDKTEVYACDDGYVINAYPSYYNGGALYAGHKSLGGLLEIRHSDGSTSLYGHLSMTLVTEGTFVRRGQLIGWTGGVKGRRGSGVSTGPHLHFAIYVDIESLLE